MALKDTRDGRNLLRSCEHFEESLERLRAEMAASGDSVPDRDAPGQPVSADDEHLYSREQET